MLLAPLLLAGTPGRPLDFALNAPDATVLHAYRADEYTAGNWPDRVGSADLVQATGSLQPAAISDGGSGFNNQPVVRFDGSDDYLSVAMTIAEPHWVAVICKSTLDNATGKFLISSTNAGTRSDLSFNANEAVELIISSAVGGSSGSLLNSANLVFGLFNAASSEIRVNSVLTDGPINPGTSSKDGLTVGQFATGGNIWGGDVAEIIVGSGTLTQADLRSLAKYANQKYSIPAPFPQTAAPTETSFSSETTSHAVGMPATVNSGDLLMVTIGVTDNGGSSRPTIATPSGWTELWSSFYSNSNSEHECGTWIKVADGTEGGGTVDFVTTNAAAGAAQCYRVTDWSGALSGVEVGSVGAGASTEPDAPGLTPSWGSENTLWFFAGAASDDDETISAYPTNYSDGVDTISGAGTNSGATVFSARRERGAASEDPGSATLTSSEAWRAVTIAIRPIS